MQKAKSKKQKGGKGKGKRSLIIGLLALFLLAQLPCFSAWGNKRLPPINTAEKINYVNINWWDNFSDPYLKCYILQAIENNHETKQASWKVEEYKHSVKLQFSQELPSLSVGSTYIGNHLPDTVKGTKSAIFAVPFIASYEADIFLKNHDKTKSSKKAYQASKFQEQSIYISLASDVATTYINIIKFDKQIQLQQEIVKVKEEEFLREKARYKRGVVSIPQLNDTKKAYESAKSNLDETIKLRDKALNQLAVLIGESPECTVLKRSSWDNFGYKSQIPAEISSDVVFSRPDILAAEANLGKAGIDVRVARKEFLPRININGIYSFSNIGSSGFGTWDSTIAAIIAGATLDLFKGGYKIANLKVNKTRYEQMFEAYRQTDLNALKEVNDSLLVIKQDSKIFDNTDTNLKLQTDNYKRAVKSYKNGVISYPELLSQQETLLNMQQNQINSKANCFINYITLYKAVGGKL
ncbi:MAG: TolC family protein [Candidatus Gastranaerophilales bacterium]|nr:TolC family protein [Candidatus Gastranaerophilales bacterium]